MEPAAQSPLDRAIANADGITKLTKLLGLSGHAVIQQWRLNGVPAKHAPDVEAATGVTCEELRADLRWVRVQDMAWPHPDGRPLLDFASMDAASEPAREGA